MKKINFETLTITLVTLLCSILFISLCFNSNVWMDEAFTATLAHNSFIGVLYRSMLDTLPPLYNVILKLTTSVFGYHIPVMKLTSVAPMILTMILGATTLRKRFGLITAVSFILCITGMPLMFYYGVEIRMYSLGFFFATASGIYAYEVICDSNKKNWILFTVLSVLAGYSHHFAFVAVGFVYLFLLIYYFFADRKHIARWFKCLGFTFLLYLPCMIITLKQFSNVSGYFSMPDITISLFIQYVLYPFMVGKITASIVCLLLVALLICLLAFKFIRKKEFTGDNIYSLACFCVYYGVLIFGTIVSKIMTANIFVDRYLFFSTGLLWIFTAVQVGKLINRKSQYLAILFIIYIGICSYLVEYKIEYSNSADEEILFLSENVNRGDILYAVGGHEELECCIPFLSLIADEHAPLTTVYSVNEALEMLEKYKDYDITLWIATFEDTAISAEDASLLSNAGYSIDKAAHFDFDRYENDMYKVIRN